VRTEVFEGALLQEDAKDFEDDEDAKHGAGGGLKAGLPFGFDWPTDEEHEKAQRSETTQNECDVEGEKQVAARLFG
jgi:hypothetical protein